MNQLLTLDAAALMLGKGRSTIKTWIREGDLHKHTVMGRTCVDMVEVMSVDAAKFEAKQLRMKKINDTRKL